MFETNGAEESRPIQILGIGGSLSATSRSLIALETALRLAEEAGAETTLADVRSLDLPVYDPSRALIDYPPSLAWLLEQARAADAFLLCSPTYHGTISGAVKNVLDALEFLGDDTPRYFGGKVVGLMALGGGGAVNVFNALGHATCALNGLAAPTVVAVPGSAIDAGARDIADPAMRRRLAGLTGEVLDLTRRLHRPAPLPAAVL